MLNTKENTKMKTTKIVAGNYEVIFNGHKFQIINVETMFGMEWQINEVILNQPLNIDSGIVERLVTEPFETSEPLDIYPTLSSAKDSIVRGYENREKGDF
tara:strand:- start:150 stop:449 length:300 start_codon:yes stop_codon:yes gene_type:complete